MVSVKLTGGKKERNPHSEKGENIREGENTGGKRERESESKGKCDSTSR